MPRHKYQLKEHHQEQIVNAANSPSALLHTSHTTQAYFRPVSLRSSEPEVIAGIMADKLTRIAIVNSDKCKPRVRRISPPKSSQGGGTSIAD